MNTHLVTDENGCPTDPTIFGPWTQHPETRTLVSTFNAFKFPASDNIRFQCNIRVCFGRCQPVKSTFRVLGMPFFEFHCYVIHIFYIQGTSNKVSTFKRVY